MKRTWKYTDLEFLVMWEGVQKDFLPIPLSYVAPPTWDEFDRRKGDARDRLFRSRNRDFDEVLEALARPDIRVSIRALDDRDPEKPETSIRIHGVRKGDRGFVVRQLPGETNWHSAGFEITECEAITLADAVVQELPDAPASKISDLLLASNDGASEGYEYLESAVFDSFEDSVDRKIEQFFATPVSTIGLIEIVQGISRFGPRGVLRRQLEIRDLIDDGRCVITSDSPRIASGVDAKGLVAKINLEIAEVIRVIRDERV